MRLNIRKFSLISSRLCRDTVLQVAQHPNLAALAAPDWFSIYREKFEERVEMERKGAGWEECVRKSIEMDTFPTEMSSLTRMERCWELEIIP
jgi:hypothetical protein